MANVPHDHEGKGVSFGTAILSTLLYGGRAGEESSKCKELVESAR